MLRPMSLFQLDLVPNTTDPTVILLWSTAVKSDRICAACGAPFLKPRLRGLRLPL